MTTVHMMIGCPGAGKSTYVKNKYSGLPVISSDIMRAELGYCKPGEKVVLSFDKEQRVADLSANKMRDFIKEGKDFVLDNTNTNLFFLKKLIEKIRSFGTVKLEAILMDTPESVCYSRRSSDGFDQNTIHKIYSEYERVKKLSDTLGFDSVKLISYNNN